MDEQLKTIAKIHTDFKEKFGIPRQSGLVPQTRALIVFEPEYRNPEAIKGIEEYSHLWLIWGFSQVKSDKFTATVKPPRLGGKVKKGVFATRSPFRPNRMGLSSVELIESYVDEVHGPVLVVAGADILDQSPIYDIKPYLPYTDSHPEALGSFGELHKEDSIEVAFEAEIFNKVPEGIRDAIIGILKQDPRAAYNKGEDYVYGMAYGSYDVRFKVDGNTLNIIQVLNRDDSGWDKIK